MPKPPASERPWQELLAGHHSRKPWRRKLRLGPSRRELAEEIRSTQKDREREVERARLALAEVRRLRAQFIREFTEPPPNPDGSCSKIRLHTEAEALEFAANVARDCREDPDVYRAYQCKDCPRHPATTTRYWHVGHREGRSASARKERNRARAREQARGMHIAARVDPTVLAKLRKRSA